MLFKALFSIAICAIQVLALDFSASKWIWTNEIDSAGNAPAGSRAFRRDFYSPQGKTALSANIIITSDNGYTLYVNGQEIGMGHNFKAAEAYCIRLAPDCNVFAVNATNDLTIRNPAGLLATIQIKYTDGFTDTIVTDASWHSFTSVPNGFQNNDFDDSAWPPATIEGNYGVSPWNAVTIPSSASSTPLTLSDANWIWTNEVSGGNAPVGTRAFRKDITLPTGQRATSATFLVDADNGYTLYLQGNIVGSGDDFTSAQRYVADLEPSASQISIVAFTANTGGPAGFIAAVELEMEDCDCGSVTSFVTDGTWKYSISPPSGFQNATFDASGWPNAVVEGKYGIAPWGNVPVPDTISTSVAPIPGAPAAMSAKVVQ